MPARVSRVRPAARAQRASSEGRMSRSYSCVPRGTKLRRYSAPTIASRKDLRLRLMVETNSAPPGRSARARVAVMAAGAGKRPQALLPLFEPVVGTIGLPAHAQHERLVEERDH